MPRANRPPDADPLAAYRAKRSAERTPEPFGGALADSDPLPGGRGLYVIQKHDATHLHYDFRLELGGTLKSWAVPKGPSPDLAEKRLAMEVEDHPIEYAEFEGIIPDGNYGAGPVIVWDRGVWHPLEDPVEGMRKGKLLFELTGYKLRGQWHLFRTKGTGKEWLLIKKPDGWAGAAGQRLIHEESILSGLTLEELGEGPKRTAEIEAELARRGAPEREVRAKVADLMLAETGEKAFTDPAWLFELKYDGFRVLAERNGGEARLFFRRGLDATAAFPEVARAVAALPYPRFVLDGEVVVLGEGGKPSFNGLQKRALLTRSREVARAAVETPATFYLFDLLAFSRFDVRPLPLIARKELLARMVPRSGPLRFATHVDAQGEALFAEIGKLGLEGIMGKRKDAPYRAGRSPSWVKLKSERTGDFVVVGFSPPKGGRTGFGALHLAAYDGEALVYAGKAGSGFTEKGLVAARERLEPLRRATPACTGDLSKEKGHVWLEPTQVAEVRYLEWTNDRLLRHPVFLRFRDDKPPQDCLFAAEGAHAGEPDPPPERVVVEKKVTFSNLGKVFWPEDGYTKGDLIGFYRAIAPWILPYLIDRPLVLTRFPDGIHGKSFFQKDSPGFTPPWIRTERVFSDESKREIDYFICDDVETLLFLANLGTIPLHVWASRVGTPGRPDWSILDLDPKGAPFTDVVKAALAARELCEEIGLPSYVKTSGSTGLHVLIPTGRQLSFAEAKILGELIARVVASRLPEITTTIRPVEARGGRVYLDFLQNGQGKLIASAFCVRPRPGATVSTPLLWKEVTLDLDPSRFTIRTVPERFQEMEDPMRAVLTDTPDLAGALARLGERFARSGAS